MTEDALTAEDFAKPTRKMTRSERRELRSEVKALIALTSALEGRVAQFRPQDTGDTQACINDAVYELSHGYAFLR